MDREVWQATVLRVTKDSDTSENAGTHAHRYSVKFSSVTQLCLTLCEPMDWSTPGFPVHHQLPELDQIHVHLVSDAIQPSHPL